MDTQDLDRLCEDLCTLEARVAAAKEVLESASKAYDAKEREILIVLDALDRAEYVSPIGKYKKSFRTYFKMEDREAALNWLKERGEYEQMVTVNANSFSSHVKKVVEEKREAGDMIWLPPGVEDSTSDRAKIKITRTK